MPRLIAGRIGCSVTDLLLINNQRPCFERTPLKPSTKLLKHTWLLQPLPQTFLGQVCGFARPQGRQTFLRVIDTQDGYVVEETVLRRAISAARAILYTNQAILMMENQVSSLKNDDDFGPTRSACGGRPGGPVGTYTGKNDNFRLVFY